jgi:hypothetical protein
VLDDAGALGFAADHVAGRVLKVDDRHVGLTAELDELRRLGRAVGVDRPVVADEADGAPFDLGVAAYRVRAVERLEIEEIGFVDDAGDDLAHVVRLAVVARHDAGQLLGRIARLLEGLLLARRELFIPRKLGHDFARDSDAVRIVLGEIFAEAGDCRVHFRAAKLFVGRDLAGRGAQQRRAGEKDLGATAHQDHVVRQAGQVRTAGGWGAVHHDLQMPAADMRAWLAKPRPPSTNISAWYNGWRRRTRRAHERRLFSRAICWMRRCFFTPIGVEVPPLIALSLAETMRRMPDT